MTLVISCCCFFIINKTQSECDIPRFWILAERRILYCKSTRKGSKVKRVGVEPVRHVRSCSNPVCSLRLVIYSFYERILWVHDGETRNNCQSLRKGEFLTYYSACNYMTEFGKIKNPLNMKWTTAHPHRKSFEVVPTVIQIKSRWFDSDHKLL